MARLSLESRRQKFIDAAIEVVARDGMAQATTRRIAEAANSPLAGLHYCFETKEDLFQAVFEACLNLELEDSKRKIEPRMGLQNAVATILGALDQWQDKNRSMQQAQFELFHWALRNPGCEHLARDAYETAVGGTAEQLKIARKDNEMGIDIEMLASHIVALSDGHGMQKLSEPESRGSPAISHAIRVLQESIAAEKSATKNA